MTMWQCRFCRERFIEEDPSHVCMTDSVSRHFKGRRALLEPLFRTFLQKLQRIGVIRASSEDSFIVLSGNNSFAIVRVAQDHLEIFLKLPESAPIAPSLISAARLRIPGMTHYYAMHSIADLKPDIMRSLMWAKEASDNQ